MNEKCIYEISHSIDILPDELRSYLIKRQKSTFLLHIDGGARGNPGESGIGIVSNYNNQKKGYYYYTGFSTNNEAEYNALIKGLQLAVGKKVDDVIVYSDSQLICNQIKGIYKIKSNSLLFLYKRAVDLIKEFKSFSISHIPRERNKEADKMVNMAIDFKQDGEIELAVAESLKN